MVGSKGDGDWVIFLGGRGEGVLIVSREQSMLQLSHFAALTECLTCFSASIWHISQGEVGVGTEGSDLRGSACVKEWYFWLCLWERTCISVMCFLFLPVSCPVVGLRPWEPRSSWVGDRRGEEVGKKAELVLADLPYHKTQIQKNHPRSKTKHTHTYCKNTYW